MSVAALKAGRRRAPIYGLIDVDVTAPRRFISESSDDLSLTAFIVASVARAASRQPEVHAYRDWRGRLVIHDHVDVNTLVEVDTFAGKFPLAFVIRDADLLSVETITTQLRTAKRDPRATGSGRFLSRPAMSLVRVPLVATTLFRLGSRSIRARQRMGTVSVTSIGMFGGGSGYGLGGATVYSLGIVVGGLSRQPRFIEGRIDARDILNLTITVDHNMVDGAPAARFVADLRQTIESGVVLGD